MRTFARKPDLLEPTPSGLPLGLERVTDFDSWNTPGGLVAGPNSVVRVRGWSRSQPDHPVPPPPEEIVAMRAQLTEALARWTLAEYEGSLLQPVSTSKSVSRYRMPSGQILLSAQAWAKARGYKATTDPNGVCRIWVGRRELVLPAASPAALLDGREIPVPGVICSREGDILIPESLAERL